MKKPNPGHSTVVTELSGPPDSTVVEFRGRAFLLDGRGGTDLVVAKMQAGTYEAPLPSLISVLAERQSGAFLDVGANNGLYSILAATANSSLKVIAFEPYQPVVELLKRNLELNRLEGRVKVAEIALSDVDGTAVIYLPDQGHGLIETSASLQSDFIAGAEPTGEVQTARLDSIVLDAPIALAKVDIEGMELEFIRGAEKTLERQRPIVFAEMLSGAEFKFSEISERLSALNYMAFRLRPEAAIFSQQIVFDNLAWNYGLIPAEKAEVFENACHEIGLEVLST